MTDWDVKKHNFLVYMLTKTIIDIENLKEWQELETEGGKLLKQVTQLEYELYLNEEIFGATVLDVTKKLDAIREIKQDLIDCINTVYDGENCDEERDELLKRLQEEMDE